MSGAAHPAAASHDADGAIAAPSCAFGIDLSCSNNLHYLEGQRLLFPAGQLFVCLDADDGKSAFIPTAASAKAVRLLQLSNNKRHLAAAEWPHAATTTSGAEQQQQQQSQQQQQQVSVYNVPAQKREQTLQLAPHTRSSTVTAMSFSGDSKTLATLTGEPDWTVLLWRWQQAKVVLVVRPDCPAVSACLSLWDDGLLAVAGPHAVKAYRFDTRNLTGGAKANNVLMLDSHKSTTVTCLAHLVGGMMAVGTSVGTVVVCSGTAVLSSYDISPGAAGGASPAPDASNSLTGGSRTPRSVSGGVTALLSLEPASAASTPKGRSRNSVVPPWLASPKEAGKGSPAAAAVAGQHAVQAIVQRGRGFVVASSNGDIHLFDPAASGSRSGSADAFQVSQVFRFAEPAGKWLPNSLAAARSSGGGSGRASSADASISTDGNGSMLGLADASSSAFSHLPPTLRVCGLAVSATDEHLGVATAAGKLLMLNIAAAVEARELDAEIASSMGLPGGDAAAGAAAAAGHGADGGNAGEQHNVGAGGLEVVATGIVGGSGQEQVSGWQVVSSGFATARVVGLDATQHLPLLLVASEDGWVRVWDWMRRTRLAARHMGSNKQPLCCSLHPSGLMAAVGTREGLAVFWLLKDALSPVAELPVIKCNVARYSHTGGLLAAAGGNNTITVFPAWYGHEGAAGRAFPSCRQASHTRAHSAAAGGGSGDASAVLEAVAVLKGHVSSVTDLVFTGDDRRLISTGAGGACYFWDISTGTRLIELEYVDKKCVYCSASFSDCDGAAVVRTIDGRVQHIKDGQLVYEAAGLPSDCCPIAMTGDGRVVLAATCAGAVISLGWPKHPGAAADSAASTAPDDAYDGMDFSLSGCTPKPPYLGGTPGSPGGLKLQAAGAYKHLSVQVDAASSSVSPRGGANSSSKSAGSTPSNSNTQAGTPDAQGRGVHGKGAGQSHGKSSSGCGGSSGTACGGADSKGALQGRHEYRLHASRITAIKVLHHAGVMFTASTDGVVLMSSLSLVLDGVLIEPPPLTLPLSATAQCSAFASSFAGSLGGTTQTGVSGLPPPIVLIDDAVILSLHDKVRSQQHKMAAMQQDAQYQVLRQTQGLKEALVVSDSQVVSLQGQVEQLKAEVEQCRRKAETDQEQILKDLEGLHLSAAEQLESLYEARLALEKERLRQMAAAKDDTELSLKEAMKRQAAAAAKELEEVHRMYKQQLAAEATRAEAAAAAAVEADAVWQEVLMQTEEDLDKRAETDGARLATLQRTAEETQMKLRAEVNILSRGNERLKSEKTADAARVAALQTELKVLQQQLADAGVVADKLRVELMERDGVISDGYVTMQGLRRRVQELETHKFVLAYKNESVAAELQPKEEQLELMQATVHAQDKELLAGRSALLAAQRAVAERSAAITSTKQELWETKRKLAHHSALLDAVAHDIAYVLQQPDERVPGGKTATQQALEKLAVKYCTKRGGGPRTSVQVEAEMMAHIAAAEKKSNILERQLNQALVDKQHNTRRLMADNTVLLSDLSELHRTNRELSQKLAAAMHQLMGLRAQQESGNSSCSSGGGSGAEPGFSLGIAGSVEALQQQPEDEPQPSNQRIGRSQGVRMGGQIVSATEGPYLQAALRQQWQQLADLQAALEAARSVVAMQAAHISRLQQQADAEQAQRNQQGLGSPPPGRLSSPSPPLGAAAGARSKALCTARPKTAEGNSRPQAPSPPGGLSDRQRPRTSNHSGMMASIKSDLEAWRSK